MPFELGLIIYQNFATTGQLSSLIIHTAQEARRLEKGCEVVQKYAEIVESILNKNHQDDESDKKTR
jgi:hypothetical protein